MFIKCIGMSNKETELKNKLSFIKCDELPIFSLNGLKTIGKIVDMYDGDTCKIVLIHENNLKKFTCRLMGLDTPEMKPPLSKPDRDTEIKNAHRCRNKLLQLLTNCDCEIDTIYKKPELKNKLETNTKTIGVECFEFDKYGRLLVNLYCDENFNEEKLVNNILVREKFAKNYDGGKKDVFVYEE